MFKFVDIETTSYCNAKCPFCVRADVEFEQKHLELEIIKKLPFEKIKRILLLGNKGDCIFYPQLFELIEHIKERGSKLSLFTNASAHDKNWWKELANILDGNDEVTYALDGLEDTHSLHRIGTNFHKVVENIRTFTENGGKSHCQFLKFKENEHQVDKVRKIANSIGSTKFWVRKSRAYNDILHRPKNTKTRHELAREKTHVKCVFLNEKSFVLTVDGEIRPCCFMADDDYKKDFKIHFKHDVYHPQHIIRYLRYPDSINLKHHTLDEIFESEYYEAIRKNYRKLHRCNQKCTVGFSDIIDQCLLR